MLGSEDKILALLYGEKRRRRKNGKGEEKLRTSQASYSAGRRASHATNCDFVHGTHLVFAAVGSDAHIACDC